MKTAKLEMVMLNMKQISNGINIIYDTVPFAAFSYHNRGEGVNALEGPQSYKASSL